MVDRSTSLARKGRAKFGTLVIEDLATECPYSASEGTVREHIEKQYAYLSWSDLDSLTEAVYRTKGGLRF